MIFGHLTEETCFGDKGPNQDIKATFQEISRIMIAEFGLKKPKWWLRAYPVKQ